MKTNTTMTAALLSLALAACVLAACGGTSTDDIASEGDGEGAPAGETPPASGTEVPSSGGKAPSTPPPRGGTNAPSAPATPAPPQPQPQPQPPTDCTPSTSIACKNGSCSCQAGPHKGETCIADASGSATSCSVLCAYCK